MIICLCATRNMYPQLCTSIQMILDTQPNLTKIYAFVEDNLTSISQKIEFINVSNFEPVTKNEINNGKQWSYMTLIRCYFTELLPKEDKVIYIDLDTIIHSELDELWNIDMTNYEVAGVVDAGVSNHKVPYLENYPNYINAGVLLMNLKLIRESKINIEIDKLLHSQPLFFQDQDAINLCCSHRLIIDSKWNSGHVTQISEDPKITHAVCVKPWDPRSVWFKQWSLTYFRSKSPFSTIVI